MTDRERFLETMRFGRPDRIPYWECAFWGDTLGRWGGEGLSDEVIHPGGPGTGATEQSLAKHFGFDRSWGTNFRSTMRVNLGFIPGFERKVLSDENGIITEQGGDGVISRWSRDGQSTRQFVELIPIWLDGGINAIWPFEIAAGMDPVKVRRKYGKSLAIVGGVDKRALAAGKREIDREVSRIVAPLVESGGFIPCCDHAVPPDVSLAHYEYYIGLIHRLAEGR